MSRLRFNYSISHYPRTVNEIMAEAIPWTVGLLGTTTVLSFTIGTFLGGLRDLCRGEGPQEPHCLPALLRAQRDSSPDHSPGAGPGTDPLWSSPRRSDFCLSRHWHGVVPCDSGERPFSHPRYCLLGHCGA